MKALDLTGQKFGRLTVVRRGPKTKNGKFTWECVCECGRTASPVGSNIKSGNSRSCGVCTKSQSKSWHKSFVGKRFGRLVVLSKIAPPGVRENKTMWRCECDCGKIVSVRTSYLNNGDTKSCGCLQRESPHRFTHGLTGTPEYHAAHCTLRRARIKGATGRFSVSDWQGRLAYYGGKCVYCGTDRDITVEHRIPVSRGGANWPANLVPACKSCNSKKAAKTETEYKQLLASKEQNQ